MSDTAVLKPNGYLLAPDVTCLGEDRALDATRTNNRVALVVALVGRIGRSIRGGSLIGRLAAVLTYRGAGGEGRAAVVARPIVIGRRVSVVTNADCHLL